MFSGGAAEEARRCCWCSRSASPPSPVEVLSWPCSARRSRSSSSRACRRSRRVAICASRSASRSRRAAISFACAASSSSLAERSSLWSEIF